MATLKETAQRILTEKQQKIIPGNIKNAVQIFDVTGNYNPAPVAVPTTTIYPADTVTFYNKRLTQALRSILTQEQLNTSIYIDDCAGNWSLILAKGNIVDSNSPNMINGIGICFGEEAQSLDGSGFSLNQAYQEPTYFSWYKSTISWLNPATWSSLQHGGTVEDLIEMLEDCNDVISTSFDSQNTNPPTFINITNSVTFIKSDNTTFSVDTGVTFLEVTHV